MINNVIGKQGRLFIAGGQLFFNNVQGSNNQQNAMLEANQSFYGSQLPTGAEPEFSAEINGEQPALPAELVDNNFMPTPKTEVTAQIQGMGQSWGFINVLIENDQFEYDATNGGMMTESIDFVADAITRRSQGHGQTAFDLGRQEAFSQPLGGPGSVLG